VELGIDIVEIRRIKVLGTKTPRFLDRVFTKDEIAYCRDKSNPWQHFAVRFAAKEAVWKALGRERVALRDISISRDRRGKPSVLLKGRPLKGCRVSLTHCEEYAAAVASFGR
jgi:holo-[acyl-carrier protein] synthase